MKILITGATGLIGKELTKLLLNKNHTVNYLTTTKSKISNADNYFGFYWNPQEGKIDENALIGVDVIINLAGASISKRWTSTYKQEIIESRTLTSELLFSVLKKKSHQVKQIISASGTAIYPESYSKVYDETTTEKENSFLSHVVSKWEESVDRFNLLHIKVCKIRTGVVFARYGGALPEMAKPIKMGFGAIMGNGKQIQSWIHLQDLVNLYLFVLENNLEGIYNAVAPQTVSNTILTKEIASVLHKPLFLPNIPKFLMKLILGEMAYLLFSSKNLSAKKIQNLGFCFHFPSVKESLKEIYK